MKTLLKIFVGIASIVLFSSCLAYQHVRLTSNAPLTNESEFMVENDSIRIIYSFLGKGGQIHLQIFNKLNKPLTVDWSKSALIKNDQSYSLWKDEARLNGTSTEFNIIPQNEVVNSVSNFEGKIVKKDKVTFIPPQSKIVFNGYTVQWKLFDVPEQGGEKIKVYTLEGKRRATKYSFSKEDSPLSFRIFLSFSMDEGNKSPFQIDKPFWVSDYFTSYTSPSALGIHPGNQFFNY
jgi:hypothetical protein